MKFFFILPIYSRLHIPTVNFFSALALLRPGFIHLPVEKLVLGKCMFRTQNLYGSQSRMQWSYKFYRVKVYNFIVKMAKSILVVVESQCILYGRHVC